jgi:hypothetical protein
LQPHGLGADGDGLANDIGRFVRGSKHDHQIDRLGDVGQPPVDLQSGDRVGVGIDRDHLPSVARELERHGVGVLGG